MVSDDRIKQHFRPDEFAFIAQIEDWLRRVSFDSREFLTPFLNPREQYILSSLVARQKNLQLSFNGGVASAEARRAIIAPDYFDLSQANFEIGLLGIDYPQKFNHLRQADILGAVLASGLDRKRLGDILSDANENQWQLLIDQQLVNFITQNVDHIGNSKVNWLALALNSAYDKLDAGQEEFALLASMRIDLVIAAIFGLSRQVAKTMIDQKLVRINWATCQKADSLIDIGDIISVRQYGRLRLLTVTGRSKKDKIKATFNVIKR
ncbi:YlmH family RNA-binding protein [Convivina praedatoris]|uniref:RNA-binding S4 domain-containing protein n=1 Tax=Convivina praedatoris TaxID=2880963 RepID=A0ABN8HEU8_9LACO|nr:YlmH/Sll1252 family protein [Convivina sp. LMG 32447]CAH1854366.1 hypothetical protein R077815_01026 [Convivina sp. LMG 32447]CAH1855598.1 hypothetical protein R078138_01161 [Convivina sp. LMG 32447]CAH1855678.1 hypothetical protein LMG032447_01140 [Convivina sp. LMG 32447]